MAWSTSTPWDIRTAYPGVLGISKPIEPPDGCEFVTFQGVIVTYGGFPVYYCGEIPPEAVD